jgi:F0F1-type ATP synthase delta subunit
VLPEIRDLFVALKNEHEGVREAQIASAFPLDDAALAALKADLEARFKAAVNVTVSIDPELIGGVRIAVGDEVIDATKGFSFFAFSESDEPNDKQAVRHIIPLTTKPTIFCNLFILHIF